jgi:hypothetical protein
MSQSTLINIPNNLDVLLRRATSRVLVVAAGWSAARVLAVVIAFVLSMLLLDALFHFAPWVRIALNVALIATILGGAGYVARVLYTLRYNPTRTAVLVEQRLGVSNSQLINAVQFCAGAGPQQSPALVEATIREGNELAGSLKLKKIADTAPLKLAMRNLALVAFAVLIVLLGSPGIFYAGIPRYLAPYAYHPPFTTLVFKVKIEPERVLFGQRAIINAAVAGDSDLAQASIVFVDDNDKPEQRVAMRRKNVVSANAANADNASPAAQFTLVIDRAQTTRRFYIETPRGQSKLYTLNVLPVPQFKDSTVRLVYPAYTKWPADTQPLDGSGIRVLEGTDAAISITSNLPLSGGTLTFTPKPAADDEDQDAVDDTVSTVGDDPPTEPIEYELTPRTDDPTIADVTLPIRFDGTFEITLRAFDGTPSSSQLVGDVIPVPDRRPRIDIIDPPQTVMVPTNHVLDVQIAADDDIGISKLQITRAVNGWASSTAPLPFEGSDGNTARTGARYTFDLPALGVQPGDVITYFATAFDNRGKPNGPHQSADSEIHLIQVISVAEFLEYERTKYGIEDINEEFEDITDQLADLEAMRDDIAEAMQPLLDKLKNGEALTPAEQAQLAELQAQLQAFEAQAADLREQLEQRAEMTELYEFEKPYNELLKQLAEDLKQQEQKAQAAREAIDDLQQQEKNAQQDASQAAQMTQARKNASVKLEDFANPDEQQHAESPFGEAMQQQLQQNQEQLKQLELADRLMAELDRLAAIIEAQRAIEKRLSAFEDKDTPDLAEQLRARELGIEQEELREELESTKQAMQAAAEEATDLLPEMSASAKEIVKQIDELGITEDMQQASQSAEAGRAAPAHAASDAAADKLESLIAQCKDCQQQLGQGQGKIDGPLKLTPEQYQKSLEQMAQGRGVPGTTPGTQPGSGSGFSQGGSQAPMTVRGPGGRQGQPGQRSARNGQQGGSGTSIGEEAGAESIEAGTSQEREASSGYIVGVPEEFREEAEAYFRRLAEENQ